MRTKTRTSAEKTTIRVGTRGLDLRVRSEEQNYPSIRRTINMKHKGKQTLSLLAFWPSEIITILPFFLHNVFSVFLVPRGRPGYTGKSAQMTHHLGLNRPPDWTPRSVPTNLLNIGYYPGVPNVRIRHVH